MSTLSHVEPLGSAVRLAPRVMRVNGHPVTEADLLAVDVLAHAIPNQGWTWYLARVRDLVARPTPIDDRTELETEILAAYQGAETAAIATDAVSEYRARVSANAVQQIRSRQENALHGAAARLRERHPERSEVECLLDAALVVAAYNKLRSEIGPAPRQTTEGR